MVINNADNRASLIHRAPLAGSTGLALLRQSRQRVAWLAAAGGLIEMRKLNHLLTVAA